MAWIEWSPRGEGIDGPKNRADFGMLMLRIMANNPGWEQSPNNVTKPGMEEAVMGPYYPRGEYTDKATFEAYGLDEVARCSQPSDATRRVAQLTRRDP